jgi:hypothetical protein
MDGERFDHLARLLATGVSRRLMLKSIVGGTLGGITRTLPVHRSSIRAKKLQPTDEDIDRCYARIQRRYEQHTAVCGTEIFDCARHVSRSGEAGEGIDWREFLVAIGACITQQSVCRIEAVEEAERSANCCPFDYCDTGCCDGKCCEDEYCCPSETQCCNRHCCEAGEVCCGGEACCTFADCQNGTCCPGQTACNGICTDLLFDNSNCGTCGNWCDPVLYRCCNGVCTERLSFQTDNDNCGECGHACELCTTCVAGSCRSLDCGSPCLACVDNSCETTCSVEECCGDGGCEPTTDVCDGQPCCGDTCCRAGEQCCSNEFCCPSDTACCGKSCCSSEEHCCPGGFCCDGLCCGDDCCFSDDTCCNEQCCPSGYDCLCDGSCQEIGSYLCGDECCYSNETCCGGWLTPGCCGPASVCCDYGCSSPYPSCFNIEPPGQ